MFICFRPAFASQAIEGRLQKELDDLAKDRTNLQLLIKNLQTVRDEALRSQSETKTRLEGTISELQADRTRLRGDLLKVRSDLLKTRSEAATNLEAALTKAREESATETQNHKNKAELYATQIKTLHGRMANDQAGFRQFKAESAVSNAKATADNIKLQEEVDALRAQLTAATSSAEAAGAATLQTQIQELQGKLTTTEQQLAELVLLSSPPHLVAGFG